jgi:hypothetical protein
VGSRSEIACRSVVEQEASYLGLISGSYHPQHDAMTPYSLVHNFRVSKLYQFASARHLLYLLSHTQDGSATMCESSLSFYQTVRYLIQGDITVRLLGSLVATLLSAANDLWHLSTGRFMTQLCYLIF